MVMETDNLKKIEKQSQKGLGFVTDFLSQLQSAKENAVSLDKNADDRIKRLQAVKATNKKVLDFIKKFD